MSDKTLAIRIIIGTALMAIALACGDQLMYFRWQWFPPLAAIVIGIIAFNLAVIVPFWGNKRAILRAYAVCFTALLLFIGQFALYGIAIALIGLSSGQGGVPFLIGSVVATLAIYGGAIYIIRRLVRTKTKPVLLDQVPTSVMKENIQ